MATAKSTLKMIPPKPVLPTEEGSVTLELSGPEARTLAAILGRVGGYPHDTARGYADNIARALNEAGVRSAQALYANEYQLKGNLVFSHGSKYTVENIHE